MPHNRSQRMVNMALKAAKAIKDKQTWTAASTSTLTSTVNVLSQHDPLNSMPNAVTHQDVVTSSTTNISNDHHEESLLDISTSSIYNQHESIIQYVSELVDDSVLDLSIVSVPEPVDPEVVVPEVVVSAPVDPEVVVPEVVPEVVVSEVVVSEVVVPEVVPEVVVSEVVVPEVVPEVVVPEVVAIDKAAVGAENVLVNQSSNKRKRKHSILGWCSDKCRQQCRKLNEDDRLQIHSSYWEKDYVVQRKWLLSVVKFEEVKSRKSNSSKTRHESRRYFLPIRKENIFEDIQVCKTMFMNTLGFTCDATITALSKVAKKDITGGLVKENRGGSSKINRQVIVDHINSFHPVQPHYRRYNAPHVRYLPRDLTVKIMYSLFNEAKPNYCSISTYEKEIKNMNISLKMPRSDMCEKCTAFQELETPTEEQIEAQNQHQQKYREAYNEYNLDKNSNTDVYSMDLEKVLILPIISGSKEVLFTSRLVSFNQTFAPLDAKKKETTTSVVWHEALNGRNAEDICSAIIKFCLTKRNVKHLIIWADNCGGQNKNWVLFTALTQLVNSVNGPETITIKYLTKGHTHMSVDSAHANIENQLKVLQPIYDFNDLKNAILKSRSSMTIIELQEPDFQKWKSGKKCMQGDIIRPIVSAKFRKGESVLLRKISFTDDWKELPFLKKKFRMDVLPEIKPIRGILRTKKEKIVSNIVPLMPENRKAFWIDLEESDQSADLQTVVPTLYF